MPGAPSSRCLLELPRGAKGKVLSCGYNREECSRLCAMGITPGTEVEMCQGSPSGCRIQVRDTVVVLTDLLARSIICAAPEPVES